MKKHVRILIGTPAYQGELSVHYVDSLINTIKLGLARNIEVMHTFLSNDALIQRARNDLFQIAYESGVDFFFFIDADMYWKPEDVFKLIGADKDFIGAPCRKKSQVEQYNVKLSEEKQEKLVDQDIIENILEVDGVGTGFLCLTKKAIAAIYEVSPEYKQDNGRKNRMVFNVEIKDGVFVSEDISFCNAWKESCEGKMYVDSTIEIGHVGTAHYSGNFNLFLTNIFRNKEEEIKEVSDVTEVTS